MAFSHGILGRSRKRAGLPVVLANGLLTGATSNDLVETILGTVTIPKGAIETTGQAIRVRVWAAAAANANTKTFRIRMNGLTGLVVASATGTLNGVQVLLEALIWRSGAATASAIGTSSTGASGSAQTNSNTLANNAQSVGNWDTADQTLVVTGQNGSSSANDCLARAWVVEVLPETPNPTDA